MRALQVIANLQKIVADHGDVELLVDTEAGTFPCHCVSIDSLDAEIDPEDENGTRRFCLVSLDQEIMQQVHPMSREKMIEVAKKLASEQKDLPPWAAVVLNEEFWKLTM